MLLNICIGVLNVVVFVVVKFDSYQVYFKIIWTGKDFTTQNAVLPHVVYVDNVLHEKHELRHS